jgi:hypothetical protein
MPTPATVATTATASAPTHARYKYKDRYGLAYILAGELLYGRREIETPVPAAHNPREPWLAYPDKGDLTLLFAHAFMDAEGLLQRVQIAVDGRGNDKGMDEGATAAFPGPETAVVPPHVADEDDFHWDECSNDALRELASAFRDNRHDLRKLQAYIYDLNQLACTGTC